MLILPYKADLRLNSRPYVTYAIMFLCVVVFFFDVSSRLMYYPYSFNVLKMITSTLSHASLPHIIFNLIFFIAFAPAVELIIENKIKFIFVLLAIAFSTNVFYSFFSMVDGRNIPTLGLSGVVTGMIGLSAYMMPWARIRTLLWLFTLIRIISVPAWILAAWFIGWDIYDIFTRTNNGGVNLVAHVTGGLSGYFIGMFYFKDRKKQIEAELNVEIDYMRSQRDKFSSIGSTYKGDMNYVDNKVRAHEAKKEFGRFKERLFRQIRANKSSEALLFLLKEHDIYKQSPEIYESLFYEMGDWDKKRVYFCTGRLAIELLLKEKQIVKMAKIIEACLEADEDFVIGNPANILIIVNSLIEIHHYELAQRLIANASEKYGKYINSCDCIMLEAHLFWQFLDKTSDAQALLKKSFDIVADKDKNKLTSYLETINPT